MAPQPVVGVDHPMVRTVRDGDSAEEAMRTHLANARTAMTFDVEAGEEAKTQEPDKSVVQPA